MAIAPHQLRPSSWPARRISAAAVRGGGRDAPAPGRTFPAWHFAMVNDSSRNEAIERSIASLDLVGRTVVEIGAGSGLVALLFAKHGAARVVTCEMSTSLAAATRRIIGNTAYADRITVVDGSSRTCIERGLLPRSPDVIFTETLDCGVVGEGFWEIARDIAELAGPRTAVLPGEVRQFASLVESPNMADLNRAGITCDFDLRPLNAYATETYFPVHAELHPYRLLSAPQQVRTYCYVDSCNDDAGLPVYAGTSGTVHGALSWFAADFGVTTVSNQPRRGSHWHQAFHPLPEPIRVERGVRTSLRIDDHGRAHVEQHC